MNRDDSAARIEEQFLFLQRHVEELDAVVQSLHDRLARLEESLRAMREDQKDLRVQITEARAPDDEVDDP